MCAKFDRSIWYSGGKNDPKIIVLQNVNKCHLMIFIIFNVALLSSDTPKKVLEKKMLEKKMLF